MLAGAPRLTSQDAYLTGKDTSLDGLDSILAGWDAIMGGWGANLAGQDKDAILACQDASVAPGHHATLGDCSEMTKH